MKKLLELMKKSGELRIGGISSKGFLYIDGGIIEYKEKGACKTLARLIDTYVYSKIHMCLDWERDDYRKYMLPPPPPEHEFDVSESYYIEIIFKNEKRFNNKTYQKLPQYFLKLLPDEVLKHLLATDRQREFIAELSLIKHLVPQPHKTIFVEASKMVKYRYLTKNEASWYITRMLNIIKEWERIYIPVEESVSP
jgi:hypothetical protein